MNEELDLEEIAPWLVLLLTVVGGLMRVFRLAQQGVWLDETFSIWLANHNVVELLHWTARYLKRPEARPLPVPASSGPPFVQLEPHFQRKNAVPFASPV